MTDATTDPPGERLAELPNGITLAYDTFGDESDAPVLLIQGLGMQMIGWPEEFCEQLAADGFYVVRFDNRDVGHSTHLEAVPAPGLRQLATRRFGSEQYSLDDMADDDALLLDELDIAPAHVVGVSLGGMIAQTLAARHPDKVRSLTSMLSTTGHRLKGQPALGMLRLLLKQAPKEREAFVEHVTKVFETIGSRGLPRDTDEVRDLAARSYDRGTDPAGSGRQLGAILRSGNRTAEVRRISVPALVIHGNEDKLVRPSGGKATAKAIADARLELIDGMGHDLPRAVWPQLVEGIAAHARRADEAAGREHAGRAAQA
jgi:pimeloyl-ACP methyl ester carboxylesterase